MDLHTDADFDLLLALARPLTPAEEARADARREDLAAYLDERGFPDDAAFVRAPGAGASGGVNVCLLPSAS